jgi:hypothetical protein
MRLVVGEHTPEDVPWIGERYQRKPEHFAHHQQHNQTAICINGYIAWWQLFGSILLIVHD